jgi:hypothetical protein
VRDEETEVFTMPDFAGILGAGKGASTSLVLFIPSQDRHNPPIDQPYWVEEALKTLGTLLGAQPPSHRGKATPASPSLMVLPRGRDRRAVYRSRS